MNKLNRKRIEAPATITKSVRCAIYTRKSTEEGLQQEFNSLDAQREAGEAFISSQSGEGWVCLPDHYDDGGYSGGTIDRPALRLLLADIEAGKIDCVVVYKVDRLSRSLLDFARMMQVFDKHRISFVSVTQQFNTTHSMGRLTLNILLSFAQFEREIISERTRDKIAATRRKGKWTGGRPILGYDVCPKEFKLRINPNEATQVREIFNLYQQHESLLQVVDELAKRNWSNKRWQSRKKGQLGGKPFTRTSVYQLLTNVVYSGRVRYKTETHPGEHEPIVPPEVWNQVQSILSRNGRTGGTVVRNRFGAFLKGLIRCKACQCAMTPTHTTRKKLKRYRYYTCVSAAKRGWKTCPVRTVPAEPIEQLVLNQIRRLVHDPVLRDEVLAKARQLSLERIAAVDRERKELESMIRDLTDALNTVTSRIVPGEFNTPHMARLADLQERITSAEARRSKLQGQADTESMMAFDPMVAKEHLMKFDPVWETLSPREQARLIALLVERVDYDGVGQQVSVTFRPAGIETLARQEQLQA